MATPVKKFGKSKSKVISIKLPINEYNQINKYNIAGHILEKQREYVKQKDDYLPNNEEEDSPNEQGDMFVSVTLVMIVNSYINLEDFQKFFYRKTILKLIEEEKKKKNNDSILAQNIEKISIRIKRQVLLEWDHYCEKHFLTRTGLIRAALHEFFSSKSKEKELSQTENYRILQLLEAIFSGFGPIDEHRIFLLFNHFERSKIVICLNQLETEGKIGRKVTEKNRTIYVPSGLIEDSGEDPNIARIFDRLI